MRSAALDLGVKETSFCEVFRGLVVARRTVRELMSWEDVLGPGLSAQGWRSRRAAKRGSSVVTTENPGINIVERKGADGGPQRLQQITPGPCANDEFGFSATQVDSTITVTLCPASCAEHEDDPTLTFTLDRGPCPPS